MRISDWSSDVCSFDLALRRADLLQRRRNDLPQLHLQQHPARAARARAAAHAAGGGGARAAARSPGSPAGRVSAGTRRELGSAAARAVVCTYVEIWGVVVQLKQKQTIED